MPVCGGNEKCLSGEKLFGLLLLNMCTVEGLINYGVCENMGFSSHSDLFIPR